MAYTKIVATAGFRHLVLFDLDASGYPVGTTSREACTVYDVTGTGGSTITSASTTALPAGTTIAGSNPYYGMTLSGVKVLTITDPNPRVLPHVGDDGIYGIQVLPALEPMTGELRVDKTNDVIDAMVSGTKMFTTGSANMFGQGTDMRGFESQVAAVATSYAQDYDPNSTTFGADYWSFGIFPKVTLFFRETGYQQEVNERIYTFQMALVTAHIWGTQFSTGTEGFKRAQMIRGVAKYKTHIVSYIGDATSLSFPFDSSKPAVAGGLTTVWKNSVIQSTGVTKSAQGLVFAVAPGAADVVVAKYESTAI